MVLTTALSDLNNLDLERKRDILVSYTSIIEICQRRQFLNKNTYLSFLDLKKAYDSVPIYDILWKINHLGIRGKFLIFLENLYLSSKSSVTINWQNLFFISIKKKKKKKKGVLQECSISTILFNLFIHDIFDVCENLGVTIYEPNVTKSSTPKILLQWFLCWWYCYLCTFQ